MTAVEQALRITPSSGLSASEIYDLIEEAGRNSETDRKMKELIIARNRLEGLLQNTIRSFSEFGWMLQTRDQEFVRSTIEEARKGAVSEDPGEVRYALEQLERAARLITDAMFRPTGLTSTSGANTEEEVPELK
jgi:molecular chaperone DnaK